MNQVQQADRGVRDVARAVMPAFCGTLLAVLPMRVLAAHGVLHAIVRDQAGQPVANAVVLAMPTDKKLLVRPKQDMNIVDQIDKEFVPHVKAVYVGSWVHFPNKDNIRHQVYSFSPAKRFELPLYAGTTAPPVLFDKPGVVVLVCNIHDWMLGYIYVSDTPFFSKTGSDGTATITGLPAGGYVVRVWHPDMTQSEDVTKRAMTVVAGVAEVSWSINLQPTFHVPRISGEGGAGYR